MAKLSVSDSPERRTGFGRANARERSINQRKLRVLLAEKMHLIAADLAFELEQEGLEVTAITHTLAETMQLIARKPIDLALMNVEFSDGKSYPAARRLKEAGIPFAFFTTFTQDEIAEDFRTAPCLRKPQDTHRIATAVKDLARRARRDPEIP